MTPRAESTSSVFVLDAMCLSCFARIDRLDVLRELLMEHECYTTYVVLTEVRRGVLDYPSLQSALGLDWLRVIRLDSLAELFCFNAWVERSGASERDLGEASVFAAAEMLGGIAITDDQGATRVARAFGLETHGTIWLLSKSCRDGKLTVAAAGNLIETLRCTGMRLPCTGSEFERWARERKLL